LPVALDAFGVMTPARGGVRIHRFERRLIMHITTLPARTELKSLLPSRWDDWFGFPWMETPKSRLPEVFQGAALPPVNVSETDKAFLVSVDLPGLEEKDIDVKLMGNQLMISAERRWEEEKKGREYHKVESQFGRFERTVMLPDNVRSGGGDATYKKGVLTVTLPKVEPTPSKKIDVKGG
jgi:HSP20 family protein